MLPRDLQREALATRSTANISSRKLPNAPSATRLAIRGQARKGRPLIGPVLDRCDGLNPDGSALQPGVALQTFTDEQMERVLEKGVGPEGETLRSPMHLYHMHPDDARAIIQDADPGSALSAFLRL